MNQICRVYFNDVKRQFPFPYPLKSIGYYPGDFNSDRSINTPERYFSIPNDQFEITLRMTYPRKKLVQFVNSVRYVNIFPHVMVKCAGGSCGYVSPYSCMNSLCLTYSRAAFQPLYEHFFRNGPLAWNIAFTPRIRELVQTIIENLTGADDFCRADRLDLYAFQLLEEMLLFRGGSRKQPRTRTAVEEIAYYMQLNCFRPLDLQTLIASHGMSSSTFFRQWKLHFTETPVCYLNRLRMEEAGRLLLETGHSLQEIADLLCFSSLSYFCASFRKYYQCSPLVYRQRRIGRKT